MEIWKREFTRRVVTKSAHEAAGDCDWEWSGEMGGVDDARTVQQQQTEAACAHEAARVSKAAVVGAVELMRVHRNDAAQQQKGCEVLSDLTIDDANRTAIGAVGGVGCVVVAMRAHANAAGVKQSGCSALGILAFNHPANQARAAL